MTELKQILIADDDDDLVESISMRCRGMGLDVIAANDAMDALANADFYAPDIALLDVRMPGGNGISVSEMMATDKRLNATSVIVMTGDPNERIQQRCHEMGARLVKKDQQIWAHLEPMIVEILQGSPKPAQSLADLSETPSGSEQETILAEQADGEDADSVLSMLKDWGWLNGSKDAESADNVEQDHAPWVLAIDDDPDFSIGLEKRLLSFDIRLVRAYRGMDGYRCAFQGRPAAILLDYHMPDGNGEYILRRLKESPATDSVPVIVVTGDSNGSLKRRMLTGGASEFLQKPVTWEQLSRTLKQYTDLDLRRTVLNQDTACTVS